MLDNKETTQNYFKGLTRKDYIERVCKIMEKDGAEDLSIRRIAKELGCSSAALYRYFNSKSELMYYVSLNTLERHFKAHIGLTPQAYLRQKRLARAAELLAQGHSVSDACVQSGFADYSHFIALFRRHFGISPLQYQKQNG